MFIDLKDANFHVPHAYQHQQFRCFAFQGQNWQVRVLPSGLSLSPKVFTRCMMAALCASAVSDMKVLSYLDDWLICAPLHAEVVQDTACLISHVAQLSLIVNLEKSCLNPCQTTTFTGVALDTTTMRAHPSAHRVDDILHLLLHFQKASYCPTSNSCIS